MTNRTRQRGVASIEAILVVTSFSLMWAGIEYLGGLSIVKQRSLSRSRSCAFLMASQSCQSVPAQCQGETRDGEDSEESRKLRRVAEDSTDEDEDMEPLRRTLSSEMGGGMFRRARAQSGAIIERPLQLGAQTVEVGEQFSLPCDPKPGSFEDKLKDTFRSVFENVKDEKRDKNEE